MMTEDVLYDYKGSSREDFSTLKIYSSSDRIQEQVIWPMAT